MTWVLKRQSPLVLFAITLVFGMFVFAWSMPSVITVMDLSGKALDLERWLWYTPLSLLRTKTYNMSEMYNHENNIFYFDVYIYIL